MIRIADIREKEGGYTLLELIIVLTITVALLSSALLLFRQRIPRTQFETAVNELSVQLTDTANQVSSGYYPNAAGLECNVFGSAPAVLNDMGSTEQGSNEDCLYIGQAIQFGLQDAGCPAGDKDNDNCDTMVSYTVFGSRLYSGAISNNLKESNPQISTTLAQSTYTNAYGLYVNEVKSASASPIGGLAFLQSFGSGTKNGSAAGASQLQIVPLKNSTTGQTKVDFANSIITTTDDEGLLTSPNPDSGITICLSSSATNQFAKLTLGENGVTNNVSRQIFNSEIEWNTAGCENS